MLWKVKKSQLILKIRILFQQRFEWVSLVYFQALMIEELTYKYYNKRITTCDNGNVQSYHKEESKLNSTITINRVAHKFTYYKIIKSTFNENNIATTKSK